jgi:high frequency lysogenization protein
MPADTRNLAIALAGLCQAVRLVQQTATGGPPDEAALAACMNGLLNTSPDSAATVFGEISGLATGIDTAIGQLGAVPAGRDMELSRYAVTVLYLERKLNRRPALLEAVRDAIEQARGQAGSPGTAHPGVMATLAGCYQQTISTLQPRIMVHGEASLLADPDNQQRIRTLLLAAIRAAVLWRQCGGGRLTLLLRRKALLQSLERLRAEARHPP